MKTNLRMNSVRVAKTLIAKILIVFMLISTVFTSIPVFAAEGPTFTDISGTYAKEAIESLANSGAISGYSDGKFLPANPITRAEFAGVITKAFKLEENPDSAKVFKDVPPSSWYSGFVGALIDAGITSGTSATTFSPKEKVTREVLVVMIIKAMGLEELVKQLPVDAKLSDLNAVSNWARPYVSFAYKVGLISGIKNEDGTYRFEPKAKAERQAAAMLVFNATTKMNNYVETAKKLIEEGKTSDKPANDSTKPAENSNSNNNGGSNNGGSNNGGNNGGNNNPQPTTSTLTGYVYDINGAPISGVKVTVSGTSTSTITVSDGRYILSGVAYGSVNLVFEAANYVSKIVNITVNSSSTTVPAVTLNAKTGQSNTSLVTGIVQNENGTPVKGVTVSILNTTGSAVTVDNGSFAVSDVPYGSYKVVFTANGYQVTSTDFNIPNSAADLGKITLKKIPAAADGTFTVTGTLLAENDTPLVGVYVYIEENNETNTPIYQAFTDINGIFTLTGIPAGTTGKLDSEFIPGYQKLSINQISVEVISDISLPPIHPQRNNTWNDILRSVTGSVTTTDGQPIEGAKVTVMNLGVVATTDSNGQYTLDNLNYEEFPLIIEAEGYIPLHIFFKNVRNGPNPPVYQLTAKSAGDQTATITGKITGWSEDNYSTMVPLNGVRVFVTDSLANTYESITDENGNYTISGIDFFGVARIRVYEPYHMIDSFDVNIPGPGTFTQDKNLYKNFDITRGVIRGNIFDAAGNPAKGVRIELTGGPTKQGIPVSDDGSFFDHSIKPGTYQLFMYTLNPTTGAIEHINTFGPVIVKANRTTELPDITFGAVEAYVTPATIYVTNSTDAPDVSNTISSQMFGDNSSTTPVVVTSSAISLVIDCGEGSLSATQDPDYSRVHVYYNYGSGDWGGPEFDDEEIIVVDNRYLVLKLDWDMFTGMYGGTYVLEIRGIKNVNNEFTNPVLLYISPVAAPTP